jgi:hypothetical protein
MRRGESLDFPRKVLRGSASVKSQYARQAERLYAIGDEEARRVIPSDLGPNP